MLTVEFDYVKLAEAMRPVIREEIQEMKKGKYGTQEWPFLMTVTQLKEFFHIKSWKASELMGRPDFPVIREAGVLIHRDKLFEWIDRNTQWVEDNTKYFKAS